MNIGAYKLNKCPRLKQISPFDRKSSPVSVGHLRYVLTRILSPQSPGKIH